MLKSLKMVLEQCRRSSNRRAWSWRSWGWASHLNHNACCVSFVSTQTLRRPLRRSSFRDQGEKACQKARRAMFLLRFCAGVCRRNKAVIRMYDMRPYNSMKHLQSWLCAWTYADQPEVVGHPKRHCIFRIEKEICWWQVSGAVLSSIIVSLTVDQSVVLSERTSQCLSYSAQSVVHLEVTFVTWCKFEADKQKPESLVKLLYQKHRGRF